MIKVLNLYRIKVKAKIKKIKISFSFLQSDQRKCRMTTNKDVNEVRLL